MTFNQSVFLIALHQETQAFDFEPIAAPKDYTFIGVLLALAVILFIVFFRWIRRQGRS